MKIRPYTDFYARLLGGFSLYHRGREIGIGISLQNRSIQMLLMILQAGLRGAERSKLLALIPPEGKSGEKNVGRRSNNLRQHLYILRKMLMRAGLPQGDYIILEGDRCYFSKTYQIDTDVSYLDRLIEKIGREETTQEEKEKLHREYCRAYTGEFLPMLGGEEWVTVESAYYQRWYGLCLKRTCEGLRKERDYETMLELCTMASQYHPYDEWQALQIECLMAMDRYKEAMEIYETAKDTIYKELSATSLDRAMERYRGKDGRSRYGINTLEKVKMGLKEEETDAPYHCSYPSFLDIYRIVARSDERSGEENLLLLCTMMPSGPPKAGGDRPEGLGGTGYGEGAYTEGEYGEGAYTEREYGEGVYGEEQEKLDALAVYTDPGRVKEAGELELARRRSVEKQMVQLKQILTGSLRSVDVYTRYSENQYLVLLPRASEEDGEQIVARLERYWKLLDKGGKAKVRFAIQGTRSPGTKGA